MNGNGWKNVLITAAIAALTAFGGMQIGLAESRVKQEEMSKRLDRLESKIDWIMQRVAEKHEAQR